jgi:hypothetical protein
MNKVKFLSILSIGLVVSNIALIVFMVYNKPPRPKHFGPRNIIIDKLDFNAEQVKTYDQLIKWHQDEITKTEKDIMVFKNKLYSNLSSDVNNQVNDSLISELGKVQMRVENIHYKHFQDIRQLCNPDQKQAFNRLTEEIASLFAMPPIKGRKK